MMKDYDDDTVKLAGRQYGKKWRLIRPGMKRPVLAAPDRGFPPLTAALFS
jgi:hypothetical protein